MNDNVRVYHVDEYCEGARHFCFSDRKDVVLLEDYEKLREENKRLKDDVDFLSMRRDNFCDAMEELVENGAVDTFDWTGGLVILAKDTNYEYLRKENAKLRCTVLHLMKEFLSLKSKSLWAFFDSPAGRTMLSADEYERLRDKAWRICNHTTYYRKAYRKAKKELKEGSNA